MAAEPTTHNPNSIAPKPPRFSWPVRIFLFIILFDMIFHSLAEALTPQYLAWARSFGLSRYPKRLLTWKEIGELQHMEDPPSLEPVWERIVESFASLPEYFDPRPGEKAEIILKNDTDRIKYAWCWLATRLDFLEGLLGLEQEWTMFSDLGDATRLPRFRLLYDDGSTVDLRPLCDPPDLTNYSRWFLEKPLDSERHTVYDEDCLRGYCHFLSHNYGTNGAGAKLSRIFMYEVHYKYPKPDEDAFAVLHNQNGPPDWDSSGPSWEYDPALDVVEQLTKTEQQTAKHKLTPTHSLGEIRPSY